MASHSHSPRTSHTIDAREFEHSNNGTLRSNMSQTRHLLSDDTSFMNEVADGIIERDRRRMKREVLRVISFISAVLSCLCAGSITSFSLYGPRFLSDLRYTQYRVNAVSITAELAMYLPVPLFGYLCDRYSPPPLSLLASFLFGFGYLLAAYTYQSGPPGDTMSRDGTAAGEGWPFGVMVLAFVGVGAGTSCMYLSAVATCAKNFAQAKYRGFMLAVPIAAFGLSGMWQSQVGAKLLYEKLPDGRKGHVDVFKYFLFLGITLITVGVIGTFGLRIIDEEELIEHGVEQLERSGLLVESDFLRPDTPESHNYGTISNGHIHGHSHGHANDGLSDSASDTSATAADDEEDDDRQLDLSASLLIQKQKESARLRRKKLWLLNHATTTFLSDRTMYLLAAGFFLITGPGEAYINNLGTIIPTLDTGPTTRNSTLTFSSAEQSPAAGAPETHVSIIALTSTLARLFTGTLSDLFAPPSNPSEPPSTRVHFSRLVLLLPSAVIQLLAFLNLSIPALTSSNPQLFMLSSALLGLGYGACFSLVPIIISVVWGAENFATNWGVVAMMPAGGAAVWSVVYSVAFSRAAKRTTGPGESAGDECRGYSCFGLWAWGCAVSVSIAVVLWIWCWRTWRRRNVIV